MKKRNKQDKTASLPEESNTPETMAEQQESGDSLEDINRALSKALSSVPEEQQPTDEADSDTVLSGELADVPALEQDGPLLEVPDEVDDSEEERIPAEDVPGQEQQKKQSDSAAAAVLRITLPLTIICIAVALMLAVVNMLTADIIAGNAAKEKENAVRAIFTDAQSVIPLSGSGNEEIYLAVRDTEILGSCVSLSENGFGGAISMMVGLDPAGSVCGVRIISMSETPGFGTRAKNDSFLAGFRGRDPFVIGGNFDALSGATITSKAVVAGVNRAMSSMPDLQAEAAQRGLRVAEVTDIPEIPQQTPASPDPEENTPEAEETTSADTDSVAALPPSPLETTPVPEDTAASSYVNLAAAIPSGTIAVRSASANRVTVVSSETVFVEETEAPVETEVPAETEAAETEPVETVPAETEPVASEPIETEAAETESAETEPVETVPAETEPVVSEPVETEPTETEPAEAEPTVPEPVETEPVESAPLESEPTETESAGTLPAETEPVETVPTETEPAETLPAAEI